MNLTYEQFITIFYIGIVAASVFFVLSAVLFILLKVPQTIGDLNGSNARKAIANIRVQNTLSGEKTYKTSKANVKRGKITEPMTGNSQKISSPITESSRPDLTTAKLAVFESDETQVLVSGTESTGFDNEVNLSDETVISTDSEYYGQTTLLGDETKVLVQSVPVDNVFFSIRLEITLHDSNQIIA